MRSLFTIGLLHTLACRTDKSITIQNPAPKADIFSHSNGDVVLEGFSTTFVGTVTDANHTPDQLRTIWYLDGEIVCDDVIPDEDGQTQCDISLDTDNSEITLAVLDAENARGETAVLVSVEPTEAPMAQIVTPAADGVYYSDQLITFEGLLSDVEDDAELLTAFWESNLDGVLSDVDTEVDSNGAVIGYGYLTEGEHAIELHVEDTTGKTARETTIIEVGPPNSAPLCEIISPEDGAASPEGDVVTFTGTTSDVDVAPDWLSVTWTSDKDGELGSVTPDSSGNIVFSYAGLSVNTHTISLQVADEVGATCTVVRTFTVGTPPSVTINSPSNGDVWGDGSPISFGATVSDAQDQPDNVSLEWVVNGSVISTQGATSTGEAIFTYGALTYGTYNLVVTATDSDGLTDSDQVNFTINGVPTTPVVSINPSTPTTSDGLNVSIDSPSVDPEGVTPTYSYEWQLGGQTQPAYTSSMLPSSVTTKGEQWTVLVTPNDGIVDGIAGTASVVIGNSAPSMSSVSISPTGSVYNDDVLTCLGIASDPDEIPTVSYEWSIGGSVVGTSSTLDVSSTGSMPGTTVVCAATATDGDGATDSNSASVSLGNRNPSISASISTNGTNQNAELTCIGTATDPDGESPTVTYEWFNGSNSLGSSNPLQLNSTLASSGDVIDCTATATDAMGGTDSVTVSYTITNTVPVITSVSVTPDPATVGTDDLTCSVSASDSDGDSLLYTYEWSDSTGVQQTTTLVPDITDTFLSGGLTEDTWTCEVTPFDGTDYGLSDTASATVQTGCKSLAFDGAGTRVTIPTDSSLNTTTFTTMFWTYLDPVNVVGGHLLVKGDNSTNEWSITYSSNSFNFNRQGLYQAMSTTQSFIPGEWHHITVSYDGSLAKMYIDGQEQVSTSFSFSPSSTPLVIGNIGACHNCATHGYLREVAFFNQVLTDSAIQDLFSFSQQPTQFGSLIGYWPLSEGTGTVANDGSGFGLDGTIVDGSWDDTCPDEDFDGDGFAAWEDCDDTDPTLLEAGTGNSSDCPAQSCNAILNDGFGSGSGVYWLDPDGNGAFEAYCDMTTDGGGWTFVGSWGDMGGYAMQDYSTGRNTNVVQSSYLTPMPGGNGSNSGPAHYGQSAINALFLGGENEYLSLTGTHLGGAILVRFSKNSYDSGYDAFRGVYETSYMMASGFTAVQQMYSPNQNPLPQPSPSWSAVNISARTTTPGDYHYLPDDITEAHQWLFRENADDTPFSSISSSSNVPSLLFIR